MQSANRLRMGAILPHTKLFGGVKRFFELAKVFKARGHEFVVFTPAGEAPAWFDDPCPVEALDHLSSYEFDALFITEVPFLDELLAANAKLKILYHVGPRVRISRVLKHKEVTIFVNSTNMYALDKRRYGIKAVKALGGISVPASPNRPAGDGGPFTVMAYGRLSRKGKGTSLVVRACEKLYKLGYNVRLLLFDSPIDEKSRERVRNFSCKAPFEFVLDHPVSENHALYNRADVFVAAERKGGWSNTAAEALAAGVPVIGTATGTRDFLIHNETGLVVWRHSYFIRKAIERLINDPELRQKLAANGRRRIAGFNWENLAAFIESYVVSKTSGRLAGEQ